jgi:hypothetical protein
MQGVDLRALIEYYEWQRVVGVPQDPRIPVAVKAELDFMWAHMWALSSSGYSAFYYNGYDQPHNSANDNDSYTLLNNLACGGYAWYWKESGDETYRDEGDACWQAAMAATPQIWFTGKDFDQLLWWSADYMGWRTVAGYTPANFPANNPVIPGGLPDTVPPVPRPAVMTNTTTGDSPADPWTGVKPVTAITSSSVAINWSTYEALATARVDFGTSVAYGRSALGSSANCASIALCNAGCNVVADPTGQMICKKSSWNTVEIPGLACSTTYHFRTVGVDAAGNQAASNTIPGVSGNNSDFTFVTAGCGSQPLPQTGVLAISQ